MITKQDCMSLLIKLEDKGINIDPYMKKLLIAKDLPIDVLKFIAQNKGIEVINFYEMLRKKHNQDKSPLYTNILKDHTDVGEVLITLSCLFVQILLYNKKLTENNDLFLKEIRAEEITRAVSDYFKDGIETTALTLIKAIKADLLVLEYINGRRELQK